MSVQFNRSNDPNASRLIESLRYLGYDNYVAIADLVDNSIDADAKNIHIKISQDKGSVKISIADDGNGMDEYILDQALRLGSLTQKDPVSDLGRFGMGLVTASLSLARQTKVITKRSDSYLTSVVDIDEVINTNRFCKYLDKASEEEIQALNSAISDSATGTLVVLTKCDGIRNQNTSVFANTLRKHIGRIHRYFLIAGKVITVNGEPVKIVDPLELDDPATEIYSDDVYEITVSQNDTVRKDNVRVRIALIPADVSGGERDVALGIKNQGFYVLRNNREIKAADTLDAFTKHNDFNRMRGEVFLSGELDTAIGIDFTKRELVFEQSFKDQLLKYIKQQCTNIKRLESSGKKVQEDPELAGLHQQAAKHIDQKAKLLLMPKTQIEKRQSPQEEAKPSQAKSEKSPRGDFHETQESTASRCKFEFSKMGANGQIYECELRGRAILIRWNIEHPFYQRFIIDQRDDGRLVTAIDYLIYSMASAELHTISEDHLEVMNNFKAMTSANIRTLLS